MFERFFFAEGEGGAERLRAAAGREEFWHDVLDRRFGGRHGHRHGHGRERLFEGGDVKLVVLKLLSEEPGYGYQIIKRLEEHLAGGYTPSAGIIYPTLTLLEEEGFAISSTEGNKKVYSITEEGREYLKENRRRLDQLSERLQEAGRGFERWRSPELLKAFMNLRGAVAARVLRGPTPEQIARITEAINAAAKAIDGI